MPKETQNTEVNGVVDNAKKAKLISRARYPITIDYNGDKMVIAPYGFIDDLDSSKVVDPLPKYVSKLEY